MIMAWFDRNEIKTKTTALFKSIWDVDTKKLTAIAVLFFILYYGIEGFDKTIVTDFKIPEEVKQNIPGIDEQSLTQQLLVELHGIKSLLNSAKMINIDMVRGLDTINVAEDPIEIHISSRINTDYKTIIEKIGTVDWGPLQVPVQLLFRPFQFLIGQKVMQLSLQRIDDRYIASGVCDNGAAWTVQEHDTDQIAMGESEKPHDISHLIQVLALKMVSSDGIEFQPKAHFLAYYHSIEGVRYLTDFYKRHLQSIADSNIDIEKANYHFEQALILKPDDYQTKFNQIIVLFELSYFMDHQQKQKTFTKIIRDVKSIYAKHPGKQSDLVDLLIAAHLLSGQAHLSAGEYEKAVKAYHIAQQYFNGKSDLQAYVYNNIGLAYERDGKFDQAIESYEKATTYNSLYARAYLNIGNVYMKKGLYAEAEKYYGIATLKRPRYLNSYYNISILYDRMQLTSSLSTIDDVSRSCLGQQALIAVNRYISGIEAEQLTRNLSMDEQDHLRYAHDLRSRLESGAAGIEPKVTIHNLGTCLVSYRQ